MSDTAISPAIGFQSRIIFPLRVALVVWMAFFQLACSDSASQTSGLPQVETKIPEIQNQQEFDAILEAAGQRLLVFDFAADWCYPCKELEPILVKIARDTTAIDIYKIDYDRQQQLARLFKVRGLPTVAFVKNSTIVYTLMGLHTEETYRQVIDSFSRDTALPESRNTSVPSASAVTPITKTPEQHGQPQ